MFRDVTIHTEKQPAPILKAKLSVCVERSNNQGCRAASLDGSCAPRLFRTFGARYQPESSCPLVHQTQRVYVTVPKPHVGVKEARASDLIAGACGNGNRRLAVPAVSLQESRCCAVTEAFCDHSTHVGSAIHGRDAVCAGIVHSWYPGEGWSMTGRHELRAEVAGKRVVETVQCASGSKTQCPRVALHSSIWNASRIARPRLLRTAHRHPKENAWSSTAVSRAARCRFRHPPGDGEHEDSCPTRSQPRRHVAGLWPNQAPPGPVPS